MNCRSCGSTQLQLILDLGKQAWGNDFIPIGENRVPEKYPLELYFCNSCAMIQIGFTVPKTEMFINHTYLSGTTKALKNHFVNVAREILRRETFDDSDFILDVGGNDGTFLEFFKENSINVLNIDSGQLQAKLSEEKGIKCLNEFFNKKSAMDIKRSAGYAKVIHGSGIFFHLEELHSAFSGIKQLLAPGGLLVAEFIYLPDMVKKCAYDQIYHEHLTYFSLISFQRLLDQFGLEIFDAQMASIHGGSCIAYIGHKDMHQKTDALRAFFAKEYAEGIDRIEIYLDFAKRAARNKEKLINMIKALRQQGLSIQALGAPVKGSTIINYCGLTEREIDCAVEINDYKCNTFYPGTKIPVYHQDKTPPADIYLLLAWNFKEEILTKMNNFRNKNKGIIIPIPEPELIECKQIYA